MYLERKGDMVKNEFVMNVTAIGTDDGKNTYEICRKWDEKGKKAIVIELYPTISVENCGILDASTMYLMNHVKDFGWGELRVVNLYATVIVSKPSVKELNHNSQAYIEEILEEKDIHMYDIIIAWGTSLSTHQDTIKAKIDLLSILEEKGLDKNVKCIIAGGMNTSVGTGIHPLYLGLRYSKDKWQLTEFPLKKRLEELKQQVKSTKTENKKKAADNKKGEKSNAYSDKKKMRAGDSKANESVSGEV